MEDDWFAVGKLGIVVVASIITGDKAPRLANFHPSIGDFLTARRL